MNYLTNVEPLDINAVKLLIKSGCYANLKDNEGKSTLHFAVRNPSIS